MTATGTTSARRATRQTSGRNQPASSQFLISAALGEHRSQVQLLADGWLSADPIQNLSIDPQGCDWLRAHGFDHPLIQLFVFKLLDSPNEHALPTGNYRSAASRWVPYVQRTRNSSVPLSLPQCASNLRNKLSDFYGRRDRLEKIGTESVGRRDKQEPRLREVRLPSRRHARSSSPATRRRRHDP
jgi:hypothetical protein